MIKVGLIGIGGMGGVHYNAYKNISGAEVVAVADVRVDMAKEKCKDDNVRIYASLDELLQNEKVDMIDICTPSYLHTALAERALLAGCHVLSEKPMSISSKDTTRVIETAKKMGKSFILKTSFVTILLSISLDVSARLLPQLQTDGILASMFGGILMGIGLSLILLRGARICRWQRCCVWRILLFPTRRSPGISSLS